MLTEQSLMQILSVRITRLNLSNHTWISLEMIGQIGYMSPHIQELNLSQTLITDPVLEELAKVCIDLVRVDLSKCLSITAQGISNFIKLKNNLQAYYYSYSSLNLEYNTPAAVNDESLYNLSFCKNLQELNVNYCETLSDIFLINLEGINQLTSFSIAGLNLFLFLNYISIILSIYLKGIKNFTKE